MKNLLTLFYCQFIDILTFLAVPNNHLLKNIKNKADFLKLNC